VISLGNISKQYGGRQVLAGVSFRIGENDRLAVVGPNGAGKSTLLRIILGEIEPDGGIVARSRADTTGYLPQEGIAHAGRTVAEEAASAFEDLLGLHEQAENIGREIERLRAAGDEESRLTDLAAELGRLQHGIEHREGWNIEYKVREVLTGLGFPLPDQDRPVEEFSGGWQMRVALAKLLLREPAVLMLDEPTNHLDLESLRWVEDYLKNYDGAVVLISHDRRFLDNVTARTVEIAGGKAAVYNGNFSAYLREREERKRLLKARYDNQQEKIRATMEFVERFRAKNTKARQVQSRLRMLAKMERIELDGDDANISFSFPPPPKPGRVVMRLEGVAKSYGDREIFSHVDLVLGRGDRLALLGPNGTGKSTLAKILAGIEGFDEGERVPGHNVAVAYYAQHRADELDPGKTVLETVAEAAPAGVQGRLRTLLGSFLFRGDDVFKEVRVLSGGEKSRLALARLLLEPANLLILDEPTNHLDMTSKAVLRDALGKFAGSFVIVSHDRDFLEPLINRVADFREGRIRLFMGGVGEYRGRIDRDTAGEEGAPGPSGGDGKHAEKSRRKEEHLRRKERRRRTERLQRDLEAAEEEIGLLEARRKQVEADLSCGETCADRERVEELSREYGELSEKLGRLYGKWEGLQEELEAVSSSS
jgi:ATP-binding cassette subfamily F protein 3